MAAHHGSTAAPSYSQQCQLSSRVAQRESSTDATVMDPAVRLQLLEQLAEQNRAAAIATMQTKAAIMAALLVLATVELWLGVIPTVAGV